jgi:hypothetical protein
VADTDAPKSSNVFTRKIGPLPMWAWVAIISVPLLVYGLYERNKKSATATSAASTGTTASTTGAGQVPQFVNQTYTTVVPPTAPAMPKTTHPQAGRPHPGTGTPAPAPAPSTTQTGGGSSTTGIQALIGQTVAAAGAALSAQGINNTLWVQGQSSYVPNAAAAQQYLNYHVVSISQDSPTHANVVIAPGG